MPTQKHIHNYEWKYQRSDLKFCPRCGAEFSVEDVHIPNQPQLVCHTCQFIFYLDPKLVVMAVVTFQGKVLLLKRAEEPGKGKWALLAGHVERGEDPYLALQREAHEETGLEITITNVLKVNSFPDVGMVQLIFAANATHDQITLNEESAAGHFFAVSKIPWGDIAFSSTKETLYEFFIDKTKHL